MGGSHVRGQVASDPKLRKSDEKPLDLLKRALVGIGCSADDFEAAHEKLKEKFKDDEKNSGGILCGDRLRPAQPHRDDQPATGGPDPYGGPPQFKPPPNFAP